ncbi:hypothetical protein [Pseudacidovorax intermedius]|uniref:hypothetical protein n=1 Tax=Pseudacidovorax intermedius TaxID=433924 RepID=UPI0026EC64E4|nr:hypothetical protein [Pseudacidovorax intermedius]
MSDLNKAEFLRLIREFESKFDSSLQELGDINDEKAKKLPYAVEFMEYERIGPVRQMRKLSLQSARNHVTSTRELFKLASVSLDSGDMNAACYYLVNAADAGARLIGFDNFTYLTNEIQGFAICLQKRALALLVELEPPEGWGSYANAFDGINAELCKYAEAVDPGKDYLDLVKRLQYWKSEHQVFGAAVAAIVKGRRVKDSKE